MKAKTKLIILVITFVVALSLIIWATIIMLNYDGYREIVKAARSAALPQIIGGVSLFIVAYIIEIITP